MKQSPDPIQSKLSPPQATSHNVQQEKSVSPTKLSCLLKPRGPSTASHRSGTFKLQCLNTENSAQEGEIIVEKRRQLSTYQKKDQYDKLIQS